MGFFQETAYRPLRPAYRLTDLLQTLSLQPQLQHLPLASFEAGHNRFYFVQHRGSIGDGCSPSKSFDLPRREDFKIANVLLFAQRAFFRASNRNL